jgi:protein SCO1/2
MNLRSMSVIALLLASPFSVRADEEIRTPATPQPVVRDEQGIPKQFEKAGIEQKLDSQVPLDLAFVDDKGKDVRLGQYFNGKPVLLVLAYYRCPRLCNQVLVGLVDRLKRMWRFLPDRDYAIVVVSFDPEDSTETAHAKKGVFLEALAKPNADRAVHFLTGKKPEIDQLCQAVGFGYDYDTEQQQYVHASAVMVLTPEGRVSKYLLGLAYAEENLRDAIENAGQNKIGSTVQTILIFCGLYDGSTGKYTATIYTVLRLAGAVVAIPLIFCLLWHYGKLMRRRPGVTAGA